MLCVGSVGVGGVGDVVGVFDFVDVGWVKLVGLCDFCFGVVYCGLGWLLCFVG